MKLLLFGPPAIGKSTIVEQLRSVGYDAYDLEWLQTTTDRIKYLETSNHVIYGAADVDPALYQNRSDYRTILLTLKTPLRYERRRLHRDRRQPEKARQPKSKLWDPAGFDYVVLANERGADVVSDIILREVRDPVLLAERGQTSR